MPFAQSDRLRRLDTPAAGLVRLAGVPNPVRPISTPLFLALTSYFIVLICVWGNLGLERLIGDWHWLNDLHYFRDAAKLILSDHYDWLYQPEVRANALFDVGAGHETFPYPATLALFYLPFRYISLETGRYVFLALSLAACCGSVLLAYRWSHDWRFAALIALAMASSYTLYETLRFSQLSPFIGLMSGLVLISLARGQHGRAGILTGLLALKPSIAIAPMLVVLLLPRWRTGLIATLVGLTVGILLPLLLVGVDGELDYLHQLGRYRDEALKLDGQFTAGAAWMLNWHGFIGRLLGRDLTALPVLLADLATLAIVVRVLLRRELYQSWLASTLGTLLIVPHAVFYDWVILLTVAPIVAYALRSPTLVAALLLLHVSVSLDSYTIVSLPQLHGTHHLYLTPLVGAAILLMLAWPPRPLPVRRALKGRGRGWILTPSAPSGVSNAQVPRRPIADAE